MITIIITAAIAAILAAACTVVFSRRHIRNNESSRYIKPEDTTKEEDYLIFEEAGAYKVTNIRNDILYDRLKELMETSKPYLNPGVRMSDIATAIGTNPSTLSNIVNRKFNMSFTELINSYRVKYAVEYIIRNPDVSNEKLKRECGFNTTSTFTNAFHRHTGMTPGEYLKKHKVKL